MILLGIETSCDETSLCVLERTRDRFVMLSHFINSQVAAHAKYGGVVPEVAARMHLEVFLPALKATLADANKTLADLDVICVTAGPGLITSLLVGVETARTLAWTLNKPLVAVNHLEGHLYANWLPDTHGLTSEHLTAPFPALGLLVSGGHTELILMRGHGQYKILGATRDDAAGEVFDKVGKILGLGYPGGPFVSKLAERGDPGAIKFPRPMLNSPELDFSFAGLKTSVRYYIEQIGRASCRERV
jgi:N6-L-threonylcarbamoyladenine synthase